MTRFSLVAGCALALVSLSGCDKKATGQVAAVVNGDEITLQEINQELGAAELPASVDKKAIQQAALQRIIDRRLVAQAARDDGIDKSPEYLMRQRQVDELLLVQMLGDKAGRASRMPDATAIDKYMAEHPQAFANRTAYLIDRIQFKMPADPKQLEQFREDHSMDAVVAKLNALGIAFQRGNVPLDSAKVPPPMMERIKALPPGEPFLLPEGATVTVGVVVATKPAPLTGPDARPVAVQLMRNVEMAKVLEQRVKTARASAKIEYQDGFAPPKETTPAKADGTATAPAKP